MPVAKRTQKQLAGKDRERNKHTPVAVTATEAILESISDGVFTVDMDWHISSFNRAAEEITGVPCVQKQCPKCGTALTREKSNMEIP